MPIKPSNINWFLLFKLPAAFFTGVRVRSIDAEKCITTVRHRWINQNPFGSMFWAVQGMAAELSTGALVMKSIKNSDHRISMLLANNSGTYFKKAVGRITFTCSDGNLIAETIERAISTKEGHICMMRSKGVDEQGNVVSEFEFEWTVKVK